MTRAQGPGTRLSFRVFGVPGAPRAIFVVRTGASATNDPDPPITARHDVRIVAIRATAAELDDSGVFGGETPAELTAASLSDLVADEVPDGSAIGLVGVAHAVEITALLAARLGDRVDRLALVAAATPSTPLGRDDTARILARITAKTLILNGQRDATAAAADARWNKDHLADARIEMVPRTGSASDTLSLTDVWPRVLSHVAPGSLRRV